MFKRLIAPRCPTLRGWVRRCSSNAAFIDGRWAPATIPLQDLAFIRGDGVFEVVPLLPAPSDATKGVPLGMKLHLDRMQNTCDTVRLPMVHSAEQITEWVYQVGAEKGPGGCRILFSRGQPDEGLAPRCIMLHSLPPASAPAPLKLQTIHAPWHFGYNSPAEEEPQQLGLWTTVKWTSYAPNCLMTRLAAEQGADDALLLAADGRVLDGPNFAVGFVIAGKLRFISPSLNRMLPSCTQAMAIVAAQGAGIPMEEGIVHISEAMEATAAFAMSATRHVMPISTIDGQKALEVDDALLLRLQEAYWKYAAAELADE